MGSLVSTVVSLGVVPYLTVLYTPSWPTDDGLLQLCGVLMLCSTFDGFFLSLISVCVRECGRGITQCFADPKLFVDSVNEDMHYVQGHRASLNNTKNYFFLKVGIMLNGS